MNRPTMGQLVNVLLAIDKELTVPKWVLDCGRGFDEINQVYQPNHPTPYV